jgi:hypothetical protein
MGRACGKAPYASQKEANYAIGQVVSRKRRARGGSMHAHRCRVCGMWHIGVEIYMSPTPRRLVAMGAFCEPADEADADEDTGLWCW